MSNFTTDIYKELNNKLREHGRTLILICAGGYVLDYYGIRGTTDIDAFYEETTEIREIIKKVGDNYGLNTPEDLWINNAVQNMNFKPPKEICKEIYSYSNLKILIPPLEYIAGMKLISGREIDIEDVGHIIKYLKINDIAKFDEIIKKYNFGNYDESLLIESFGKAYGIEWIKQYYINNEKKIINSLQSNPSNFYIKNESEVRNNTLSQSLVRKKNLFR